MMQIPLPLPSPETVLEVGVVGWCMMVFVVSGVTISAWFLHRMAAAMDRMVAAQEQAPPILARIEGLLDTRLDAIEEKVDTIVVATQRNLEIASLWERTELPNRSIKRTQ